MTFLPIVSRELRVASRRSATYWMRSGLAFVALAIGFCIFCARLDDAQNVVGPAIFYGLSGMVLLYCLGSGARSTVDCVSVEKREGTLGLLFLTDLNGFDIILGKLAATSVTGFYGLLAAFPVLAVPLLMGGVSHGEFWRVTLVLVNTFLFSLAVGMFVSVLSRDARSAMAANILILLVLVVLLPAGAGMLAAWTDDHKFYRELCLTSPGYAFVMGSARLYPAESQYYWESVALIHGLTWLLIILASILVKRVWRDKPVKTARAGVREWWRYGGAKTRARLRKKLLDVNAYCWLVCRDRRKLMRVWIFMGLVAGAWVWGLIKYGAEWQDAYAGFGVMTAVLLNLALKTWIAADCGERLAADRAAGALELLFSTPLTTRDILRGQRLALQRQFLGPVALAVLAQIVLMQLVARHLDESDLKLILTVWITGIFLFFADAVALYWVGTYTALIARTPNHAASAVILRILVLPWIAYGLVQVFVSTAASFRLIPEPGWGFYYVMWLGFGIVTDVGFGWHARRQLLRRLRELPTRQSGLLLGLLRLPMARNLIIFWFRPKPAGKDSLMK